MSPTRTISTALTIFMGLVSLPPTNAWTPEMHAQIARQAATIAPPDLFRQIKRNEKAFAAGLSASMAGRGHSDDGSALLSRLRGGSEAIIGAIEAHRPFREIVHELGRLAVYAAEANNPLAHASDDEQEPSYRTDYENYVASALPRFQVVFYGRGSDVRSDAALRHLLSETGRRGSQLYPLIGREYRRVGTIDGIGQFDDKSTAFGVGSIAFSHAVSDLAATYRYVWLSAGGADRRELPVTLPSALAAAAQARDTVDRAR